MEAGCTRVDVEGWRDGDMEVVVVLKALGGCGGGGAEGDGCCVEGAWRLCRSWWRLQRVDSVCWKC